MNAPSANNEAKEQAECDDSMFCDVLIRSDEDTKISYRSGSSVYEEAFVAGRLIGWAHNVAGYLEKTEKLGGIGLMERQHRHVFELEIDGHSLHFGWTLDTVREGPDEVDGCRHVVVEMTHQVRPVHVEVHTKLDGTSVITRWLEVTNLSDRPAAVGQVRPGCGVLLEVPPNDRRPASEMPPPWHIGSFVDARMTNEGDFRWRPITEESIQLGSSEGKSGFGSPFFVIRSDETGEIVICHLAWSGNWAVELRMSHDPETAASRLTYSMGPHALSPMRMLEPGETLKTPAVHIGSLHGDLDLATQQMHTHLRRSVLLPPIPKRDNLVIFNHWSYTGHELTERALRHEIDIAHDVGAEIFVVDAGWYGEPNVHWRKVGDWQPGGRLPNGLHPIRDYARKKGLLFGLWMEPEIIAPGTNIHREHPDWLITRDGVPSDNELDLSNAQAVQWMEQTITQLVEEYELDLFRIDYNTSMGEGGHTLRGDVIENGIWRHNEAIYGIFDRLHSRFPQLILENCSSGGGRTDIGMLSRFHHTWVTDWQQAPRSTRIFNGLSIALPPEYVDRNTGVGQDCHRMADLDFQFRTVMFGHMTIMGLYPQGLTPNPLHLQRVRHHVDTYKTHIRPIHRSSQMFHHTPELPGREPCGWAVWELSSEDRLSSVIGVFRLAGETESSRKVHPRGLNRSRRYQLTFDNSGDHLEIDGRTIIESGIEVRLSHPLTSELVLIKAI
jgi:alpha-galactosidase